MNIKTRFGNDEDEENDDAGLMGDPDCKKCGGFGEYFGEAWNEITEEMETAFIPCDCLKNK